MSPLLAAVDQIVVFGLACAAFALGRLIGIDTGRHRERERIRDRITADQTTCAADYSEAQDYADRMVQP